MQMPRFSRIFFALLVLVLVSGPVLRAQEVKNGLTWYTDINKVYEISSKQNKPVFAFFTGSDWCGWCHRLEHNVFEKPGFKEWAKKNVILLELDFPRNKQLPEELVKQNGGLQQFFQVQGYPTIWMFTMSKDKSSPNFNISALGSLGYPQSAPGREEDAFLANANAILTKKK
jgi:protein disulfide-isomerase